MKICPMCGSKNLKYMPWLGEIYKKVAKKASQGGDELGEAGGEFSGALIL